MSSQSLEAKPKLLVLLGPTAVGKTAASLQIAQWYNCEIISGDSMQVYRGMDVGTAKASTKELAQIPHHLIDIRNPDELFSVSDFQRLAEETIQSIRAKGKLPFIVGGTGLYIQSVCYDYQFIESGADEVFRREMHEYAAKHGSEALHDRLRQVDPASAQRLHPNDHRRIIRALEIAMMTGITMSEQLAKQTRTSPYELCMIGLTMERKLLYERIEQRIDLMVEQGLIEEVQRLLDDGYDASMPSMQGLGYKEIGYYLMGSMPLAEAITLLKLNTRHYAKRQLSWFRHMPGIHWVDVTEPRKKSEHLQILNDIIAGKFHVGTEYT